MTFLITGAGRGIGLEFTQQLLAKKHNVIAWVRDTAKATELQTLKRDYKDALTIQQVDIGNADSIKKTAAQVGAIDVLINNAGVFLDRSENFETLRKETLEDTFATNVVAPIQVAQSLLPHVQKSANPLIVNISSLMGSIADNSGGGSYAYRISKTALNMFTKTFSVDHPKVKMLCMHPGWVQTDMGGAGASITKEQSVTGLLKVILASQDYKSGSFVEYSGKQIPW